MASPATPSDDKDKVVPQVADPVEELHPRDGSGSCPLHTGLSCLSTSYSVHR